MAKNIKLMVSRKAIITIDLNGLDNTRAAAAIATISDPELHLDFIVARDMLEEHSTLFIYFSNGKKTLSHSNAAGDITIWEETFECEEQPTPKC